MKRFLSATFALLMALLLVTTVPTKAAEHGPCWVEPKGQHDVNAVDFTVHTGGLDGMVSWFGQQPFTVNDGWSGTAWLSYDAPIRQDQDINLSVPEQNCEPLHVHISQWEPAPSPTPVPGEPGNVSTPPPGVPSQAFSMPVEPGSKGNYCVSLTITRNENHVTVQLDTEGELPDYYVMEFSFGDDNSAWAKRDGSVFILKHDYDPAVLKNGVHITVAPTGLGDAKQCIDGIMDMAKDHTKFWASNATGQSTYVS